MATLTHADMFPNASRNTLHYPGDIADHVMSVNQRWGPDMHGALYVPQSATYDPETDTTTVRFLPKASAQPPPRRTDDQYPAPLVHPEGNRRQRRLKGKKR